MKYEIILTNNFKSDLKKIKRRNKDINKLIKVVNLLSHNEILEIKYKDHALSNSLLFKNCRECHIEPDWLLIYKKNDKELILFLMATGSHSDLF